MKKFAIVLLVLAIGAGGYYAYKRFFSSDDLVKSIPADAVFVGAFDLKSIAEKAGGEKVSQLNMIKDLREELSGDSSARIMLGILDDPGRSGINFMKRIYFFVTAEEQKPGFGLTCSLTSSADFEKLLKTLPMADSITESNGIRRMKIAGAVLFSWNARQLIVTGGIRDSMESYSNELFNHTQPSITSIKGFDKFNGSTFDIGGFMNYNLLTDMSKSFSPAGSLMKTGEMYKGVYADFRSTFEKNKITTKMNYYFDNDDARKKLLIMNDKGISEEHSKLITPKNIYALFSMSFNPDKLLGLFESEETYAEMLKEIEQQIGFKKDELKNLTNGEITFALVDIKNMVTETRKFDFDETTGEMSYKTVPDTMLLPVFTATIGIRDRATFEKVIKTTGLPKTGEYYTIDLPMAKIFLVENKTGITLTNDKEIADQIVQKKELATLPEPAKSLALKNAFAFYLDLNLKHYPDTLQKTFSMMMGEYYAPFTSTLSIFDCIEATTDQTSGQFDLKLTDGSDNSLQRILTSVDNNIYGPVKKKNDERKKMMEEYNRQMNEMDSIEANATREE
jgi:hypothetical protein